MGHDRLENPMVLDGYWSGVARQVDAVIHCRGRFDVAASRCWDCLERVECGERRGVPVPPEWPGCTEAGGVCTPDECGWMDCEERAAEGYEEDAVGERGEVGP